jgi:hypothetical protein
MHAFFSFDPFYGLYTRKIINEGSKQITELRTILLRESQKFSVYKQTKSVNNRKTENRIDPDLTGPLSPRIS